jgi:hypothetical protein
VALNGSLRQSLYLKGKRDCQPVIASMDDLFDDDGSSDLTIDALKSKLNASGGMGKAENGRLVFSGWTSSEIKALVDSKRFKAYFEDKAEISRNEFVNFQMMEGGCGKQDYGACKEKDCPKCANNDFFACPRKVRSCAKCAQGTDSFSTTIAVINSAILKLSKVTPLPAGNVLYRGINGMSYPEHLLDESIPAPNEDQVEKFKDSRSSRTDTCRGFVEFGMRPPAPVCSVLIPRVIPGDLQISDHGSAYFIICSCSHALAHLMRTVSAPDYRIFECDA